MCQRLVVIFTGLHSLTHARKDVRFLESVEPSAAWEQSQRKENNHVRCLLPYNPLTRVAANSFVFKLIRQLKNYTEYKCFCWAAKWQFAIITARLRNFLLVSFVVCSLQCYFYISRGKTFIQQWAATCDVTWWYMPLVLIRMNFVFYFNMVISQSIVVV